MMTWRKKLEVLLDTARDGRLMGLFDCENDGAPSSFLAELRTQYPFLAPIYLEFLQMTDGATFDVFVLYGSGKAVGSMSLRKSVQTWSGIIDAVKELPIGQDAAGCALCLRDSGDIVRYETKPPYLSTLVAASFDSLLNDVFMGQGILEYYSDITDADISGDHWIQFLRKQKWIRLPQDHKTL